VANDIQDQGDLKSAPTEEAEQPIIVVGVGASAKSFDSLQRLFAHLPAKCGAGYVVAVRSEDAVDAATLVESLSRQGGLKAQLAVAGARLEPDQIYVGPNDASLTVLDGHLKLEPAKQAPGHRGTIDTLLVSLAMAQEHKSVAVLLAGMGSDGALGIATVKETGGLCLAEIPPQEGATSGPTGEAPTGMVDFLAPVEQLAEQITAYARRVEHLEQSSEMDELKGQADELLPQVAVMLRNRTGHDFHGYKSNTFLRRVQRRMHVVQAASFSDYIERLRGDGDEVDNLFQDLLIGVTQFFRDPAEFEYLQRKVIPQIFNKDPDEPVRLWILGCASGEEAYSLAILLREHMAEMRTVPRVQIFATDIDGRALALARAGRYPESIARDVAPERLARWFVREGATYVVHKDLREMCIFSAHNILKDPPFSRIDLISCRNLLIYLNSDLQERVIPLFHFALKPEGNLFLGSSESVARHGKLFAPVDRKHRVYRRLETAMRVAPELPLSARMPPQSAPAIATPADRGRVAALAQRAEHIAERYAPAFVLIDRDYDILHFSGRTGRYLEPSAGVASLNLLGLVHRDLRADLRASLHKVAAEHVAVRLNRLQFGSGDQAGRVSLVVEPFGRPEEAPSFVVLFIDEGQSPDPTTEAVDPTHLRDEHVRRLDAELRLTKERLQSTIEELESANEELKSSNEEYQSINEELQSVNEELETSKEELQSINEELQTVNGELAHRVADLAKVNSDLKNLLESTQIATIFLDNNLLIRNFTPVTADIFHVVETDIGRPIGHVASRIGYAELQEDVRKVLRTLGAIERYVTNDESGSYYLARVLPYRNTDNFIAGAVLTFLDVTTLTETQEALRQSEARYRQILNSATEYAIITQDPQGVITGWNVGARNLLQWEEHEAVGRKFEILFTPEDQAAGAPAHELATALRTGRAADTRWHVRKDGTRFFADGVLTPMHDPSTPGFLKIMRDSSSERAAEERQRLLLGELQHRVRNVLAVVRSLASRTLESSTGLEDFASHFDGRLETLARTQNILTRTSEVTVDLEELVRDELTSLTAPDSDQVEVSGPVVRLRQNAAETFALAVHELATNAVKYGALSTNKGHVSVKWRVVRTSAGLRLSLQWRESGVPLVNPNPARSGFGRDLIENGLPYELGATTALEFAPGGVQASIELPLTPTTASLGGSAPKRGRDG
jgi:two-component system CheB/CheR fusion protein